MIKEILYMYLKLLLYNYRYINIIINNNYICVCIKSNIGSNFRNTNAILRFFIKIDAFTMFLHTVFTSCSLFIYNNNTFFSN